MKNFLRILAVIFSLVVIIIVIKSGVLFDIHGESDNTSVEQGEIQIDDSEQSADVSETEEEIQEIINPTTEDEGVVILGGDGIPNN